MRLRNERVRYTMHEQPFLSGLAVRPFGHAHQSDVAEAQPFQYFMHLSNLPQAAIDQQQIWRWNLAITDARVASVDRLPQCAVIVSGRDARDVEAAILLLQRTFRAEHDA